MARKRSVQRTVILAATMRTGSNLLAQALRRSGAAGEMDEHLSPEAVGGRLALPGARISTRAHLRRARRRIARDPRWWEIDADRLGPSSARRFLDGVADHATGADGVLGLKVMWHTYDGFFLGRGLDAGYWGAPVTWLRIRRDDHVRQAVSLCRAQQTDRWWADRAAIGSAEYDPDRIAGCLTGILRDEAAWDGYFARIGVDPFTVTYEHLDADCEGTVASVLAYLGHPGREVPARQLERHADGMSEEWVDRFLADRRRERNAHRLRAADAREGGERAEVEVVGEPGGGEED